MVSTLFFRIGTEFVKTLVVLIYLGLDEQLETHNHDAKNYQNNAGRAVQCFWLGFVGEYGCDSCPK